MIQPIEERLEKKHRDDVRAALLALFSMHMPEIRWDHEDGAAYIFCACGNPLYVGHLTTLITARMTNPPPPPARAPIRTASEGSGRGE